MARHAQLIVAIFDVNLNFICLSADDDLNLHSRLPSENAMSDEAITPSLITIAGLNSCASARANCARPEPRRVRAAPTG